MTLQQLRDMVGFITLVLDDQRRDVDEKNRLIAATLIHDLCGFLKNEAGFSPRSSEYGKYSRI